MRTADLTGAPFCQWGAEPSRECGCTHDDGFSQPIDTHFVVGKVYINATLWVCPPPSIPAYLRACVLMKARAPVSAVIPSLDSRILC